MTKDEMYHGDEDCPNCGYTFIFGDDIFDLDEDGGYDIIVCPECNAEIRMDWSTEITIEYDISFEIHKYPPEKKEEEIDDEDKLSGFSKSELPEKKITEFLK